MHCKLRFLSLALAVFAGIELCSAQTELGVAIANGQAVLFWPATASNSVLQSTTNLGAGWQAVTDDAPVTAGNVTQVTVSDTLSTRFFRLSNSAPSVLVDVDYRDGDAYYSSPYPPPYPYYSSTPAMSGAAATGSPGDYWNAIRVTSPGVNAQASVGGGMLKAVDGETTVPWTITMSGWSFPGNAYLFQQSPLEQIADLQGDYLVFAGSNSAPPQMIIGNLDTGTPRTLWLYAGNANNATTNNSPGIYFSVAGAANYGTQLAAGAYSYNTVPGQQYVVFTNVYPDPSGNITVTMPCASSLGNNQYLGCFNGFQLLSGAQIQNGFPVGPAGAMTTKDQWETQVLFSQTAPPFSFSYNGQASSSFLASWNYSHSFSMLDSNRTQYTLTWKNPNDGLEAQCVAVDYNDYPAVEWTVYLTNSGTAQTALIQAIQGLDTELSRQPGGEFLLNGTTGSSPVFDPFGSFTPWQTTLAANSLNSYEPNGVFGRPTWGAWPYWNLQYPGGSLILAVGWPGNWKASFSRDAAAGLRLQAGQQNTSLVLNPGETVRTPLTAMLFWQGSDSTTVSAQNQWRSWYRAHVLPKNITTPHSQMQIGGSYAQMLATVQGYTNAGIYPDICWRDAGPPDTWYSNSYSPFPYGGNDYLNTGTWDVNTQLYPPGQDFAAFSSVIHDINCPGIGPMQFLLWNEPERVGDTNYSWLAVNHPEWLLTPGSVGWILNEGNTNALDWLTNHFTTLIQAQGIDWYREDLNGNGPGATWAANDAPNRQGITENFYLQGHLAYFDALLKLNPGLKIDESGSGRADLESLRRAVPLERTDIYGELGMVTNPNNPSYSVNTNFADANQCETMGLSSWLPFYGCAAVFADPYDFRSTYAACFGMSMAAPPFDNAAQIQAYAECAKIAPCMLEGDFYPLTPYSPSNTVWMAWQFNRPDTGEGCVQIFRRTNSPVASMSFPLQGLSPAQTYDVRSFDTGDLGSFGGSNLLTSGLTVQLNPGQSAILYYTNTQGAGISATAIVRQGLSGTLSQH